ncbi:MAG: lipocalin-like domain-containing protein [Gemmatimonadota bacterium]
MNTRALACAALLLPGACGPQAERQTRSLDPAASLAGVPDSGFARATELRPFVFPEDHGPHPQFRTEWWYVTANLEGESGAEYGVQFTVFRSALAPPGAVVALPGPTSPWETRQAYMAHFAVGDVQGARFFSFERFARGAAGIAGARSEPQFRVWVDAWEIRSLEATRAGAEGIFPLRLAAADSTVSVDLVLEAGRGLVAQGEGGLSPKGDEPGQASYYYSFPRMPLSGQIRTARGTEAVTGVAWMDREWSTSVLSEDQEGWDWFALHLPDGRDLMLFELRSRVGAPRVDGTLVGPDGTARRVDSGQVAVEVLDRWTSAVDGSIYPSGWRIRLAEEDVDVTVIPLLDDQELVHTFRYWEGAVRVTDGAGSEGRGYVELTGYAGRALQR